MKIAVFIDGENISANYMDKLFLVLEKRGQVTHKKVFGDFSIIDAKAWRSVSLAHNLELIHNYTTGFKANFNDFMLSAHAMEFIATKSPECICIASNDKDFSALCIRARQLGIFVIVCALNEGLKEFCDEFYNLAESKKESKEIKEKDKQKPKVKETIQTKHGKISLLQSLKSSVKSLFSPPSNSTKTTKAQVEAFIIEHLQNNPSKNGIGALKVLISQTYKDFEMPGKFSVFLKNFKKLELIGDNSRVRIKPECKKDAV